LNQGGLERRDGKTQSDAEKAERDDMGHDLPAKEHCTKRAGCGRHRGGPKRRLALRREVENDASAIGDREPRQESPGSQFLRSLFADARGRTKLRAPPIAPVRALPAAGPWQGPRLGPRY